MLTPQEITDKVFVKAVFGGYDMTGVDDFLEAISADYTALYKENAILKGKLKVLVEKVEEYRSTEDSMRMALLTAQRMGEEITAEAIKQREETLRNTEREAKARLVETARRIADEELRLKAAAKETSKFIEISQAIMRKHSEFLTKLETARRAVIPDSEDTQVTPAEARAQESAPAKARAHEPPPAKSYAHGSASVKARAHESAPAKSYAHGSSPVKPNAQEPVSAKAYAQGPASAKSYEQEPTPAKSYAQEPSPVKTYAQKAPPTREEQLAEAAELIGDVMGKLTDGGLPSDEYVMDPDPLPTHIQVFEDDEDDEIVTPRPKFDFNDLKFGSNFNLDE